MFVLPVGHEEDRVRRWPWVSTVLGALCVVVFLGTKLVERRFEEDSLNAARRALDYAAERPYLTADEDLLFAEAAPEFGEAWPGYGRSWSDEEPDEEQIRREQAELDRLTAAWRRAGERVPARALGLVPAKMSLSSLVSHMFVHADLLHLVANLFFFWLLAPPLEDIWGRPLFAVFYLAAGIAAALLWVQRYPNSEVAVIGASGAIAGLMGAFMIRFWRTRVRFVYFIWTGLRVIPGSFRAPAWLMLGIWFLRELAFSSLFEPHTNPAGGAATWGHLYGFGAGVIGALAIRAIGVEKRWIRPRILAVTGEIENPVVEKAFELEQKGRLDEAWRLLREETQSRPGNLDAALYWWDLASRSGREREAAPRFVDAIRAELKSGQTDLAWQHYQELRERLPDLETPAGLKVALAEALVEHLGSATAIGDLLATARAQLGSSPPPGLMVRLARTSARAELPGAALACTRVAAEPSLPEAVRRELLELAEKAKAGSPARPS